MDNQSRMLSSLNKSAQTDGSPKTNSPSANSNGEPSERLPFQLGLDGSELALLAQVPMTVQVEVGRATLTLGEILSNVDVGTSIKLDRRAGDPVEVYVNGTLFARAEVVVVQDQIAAKIIEIVDGARDQRPSGLR